MRRDAVPAIGERAHRRRPARAARLPRCRARSRIGVELGGDAEPMRGAHHVLRPDLEPEPHRDRVERHRQRLRQRHRAEIFMGVVLRLPALEVERRVLADGVRRQALLRSRSDRRTA